MASVAGGDAASPQISPESASPAETPESLRPHWVRSPLVVMTRWPDGDDPLILIDAGRGSTYAQSARRWGFTAGDDTGHLLVPLLPDLLVEIGQTAITVFGPDLAGWITAPAHPGWTPIGSCLVVVNVEAYLRGQPDPARAFVEAAHIGQAVIAEVPVRHRYPRSPRLERGHPA